MPAFGAQYQDHQISHKTKLISPLHLLASPGIYWLFWSRSPPVSTPVEAFRRPPQRPSAALRNGAWTSPPDQAVG